MSKAQVLTFILKRFILHKTSVDLSVAILIDSSIMKEKQPQIQCIRFHRSRLKITDSSFCLEKQQNIF